MTLTKAVTDVLAERQRQVEKEGWTPEHDDEHVVLELPRAASCYVMAMDDRASMPLRWPWTEQDWKPSDRRRNLVKAAALIVAEIERLDRAEVK